LNTQTHDAALGRNGRPVPPSPPGGGADATNRISVQFASGPSAAAWARNALLAVERRIDPELMDDVRLLVSELVTNSVRHSHAPDDDVVRLDVALGPRALHVEVGDGGPGFDPRPRHPGQSKAGGWGLFLVERLADRWGVARNGVTRVWFEIDLVGGVRAAAAA
jgi:anti-sigma regulatory factor (Ser/Thr protein kinase)